MIKVYFRGGMAVKRASLPTLTSTLTITPILMANLPLLKTLRGLVHRSGCSCGPVGLSVIREIAFGPLTSAPSGVDLKVRAANTFPLRCFYNQGKRIIKTFSPHAVFCSRESRESREKRIVSLAFAFRTATYERQQCMFSRDSRDSREIFIFN